ncbi:MAG: alpha/beta fold hydrolase [Thermomicrobiaceae bacterium]|nr:alpha/beta fold hydrolase [Thermomicrobiaceae bacterium]
MSANPLLPGAEPFFFSGSEIGVLLSHGYTGTPQSMRWLGEFLSREAGFTVSGPLLPGHGTTPEDMAQTTAADWIRALEEALDGLRRQCSAIFVSGLSMGGTLALYLAAVYPDIVIGVVPINAAIVLDNPDLAGIAFASDAPPTIPGIGSDIKQGGVSEVAYPVVPVATLRHLYALLGVTRDLLPRVLCPLLVFQSREDHVVPPSNGDLILERAGASEKRLVWLENSYHVATLDNDRELIGREIIDFVRAQLRFGGYVGQEPPTESV